MKHRRSLLVLAAITIVSVVALFAVLRTQHSSTQRRWAPLSRMRPAEGAEVFANKCAQCHHPSAGGRPGAPPLDGVVVRSLPGLVTAMWNHAPQMWDLIEQRKLPYPALSNEETTQLTAYLYLSGAMDAPGDVRRGGELFQDKGCAKCHDPRSPAACNTPLDCTQSLWNHSRAMSSRMAAAGIVWPRFEPDDLRHLFAYAAPPRDHEAALMIGDPETGWRVFQEKGCIRCHSVRSEGSARGPALHGDPLKGDATLAQFGAALLNHVPQMQQAAGTDHPAWPTFQAHELTDLAVFLYSLNYTQPAGSAAIGKSVFAWRGCSRCHGDEAEGSSAPSLRGRGQTYTAERLATDLWRHGARMYTNSRRSGQPWPILHEGDVGHLLSFLNTPLD